MFTFPVSHFAPAGAADASFLGDLTTLGHAGILDMCLDAGSIDSYDGSAQSWLDLAGGGYDVFRGADGSSASDDPTFNASGTAGDLSSTEWFSVDGGDYFAYDTTNEAFMDAWHKALADFTILFWVYQPAAWTGGAFFGTCSTSTEIGLIIQAAGTDQFQFLIADGAVELNINSDAHGQGTGWHMWGWSIYEAGGTGFAVCDDQYWQVSSANTFTDSYDSPSSSASTDIMSLMASGSGASKMPTGWRIGGFFAFSSALTKAQTDAIFNATKGRWGL
jgi:hypothetical protein